MATAANPFKTLQEELTCCLCLEYFKHPLSVKQCSHTFCKECITQHFKKKGTKISCPVCRQDFCLNSLVENRPLDNIVEIVQQIQESPRAWGRQLKNCQELLELFCRDDQEASGSQNLKLWTGCPLSQLLEDEVKISEIPAQVTMICDAISNMGKNRNEMKDYVSRIKISITEDFTVMKKSINEQEQMVLEVLDKECRVAEQKNDAVVELLTARINKLLELQNNSEELLKNISPEQEGFVGSSTTVDEVTLDVQKINSIAYAVKKLKRSLEILLLENCPKQMLQEPSLEASSANEVLKEVEECAVASSCHSSQPQAIYQTSGCTSSMECNRDSSVPMTSSQFSPWATDVTFDLERLGKNLVLTKDKRRVTVSRYPCTYGSSSKRFCISQVLGSPGFSEGCHYWEVSTSDSTGWAIGVADGEIGSHDKLGRTELSWCIEWSNGKLSAWHKEQKTQISEKKPQRVGTFLKIPENCLSFYSCLDKETCLHTFEIKTDRPIYPAFWIYGGHQGDFLTIYNIKRS